jgi:hypothetical protein
MNPTEQQPVDSPSQLMPMTKAFTTWHLADENSRTVHPNPPDRNEESHTVRTNNMGQTVKDTGGYFHGGLND